MNKKTTQVVKINSSMSKKARQLALAEKIRQIDEELKKIGVTDLKYRIPSAINNPELYQNTINISGLMDISMIIRFIAYYNNLQIAYHLVDKDHNLPNGFLLRSVNGYLVQDVLYDLNLRLNCIINADKIKILTESRAKLMPFLDEENRLINALQEINALVESIKK